MRGLAFGLLALLFLALFPVACLAAAQIHGAFAVVAFALFVGAVVSVVAAVN